MSILKFSAKQCRMMLKKPILSGTYLITTYVTLSSYLQIKHCNKKRIYKCKEITRLENALAFSPRNYAKSSVATKVLMYNSRGELHISFNPIPKPWPKSQILFHTNCSPRDLHCKCFVC